MVVDGGADLERRSRAGRWDVVQAARSAMCFRATSSGTGRAPSRISVPSGSALKAPRAFEGSMPLSSPERGTECRGRKEGGAGIQGDRRDVESGRLRGRWSRSPSCTP